MPANSFACYEFHLILHATKVDKHQHGTAYTFCRAKDSYAQSASAWRLVQVQQQYSVTLTVPLSLTANSLAEAEPQADALVSGSNATKALAASLASGLISGVSNRDACAHTKCRSCLSSHLPDFIMCLWLLTYVCWRLTKELELHKCKKGPMHVVACPGLH